MINKNSTLTEKLINYDLEMRKNPFIPLIPLKGDMIAHAIFQDIRHDNPMKNKSLIRNITYLAEGCFYAGKYTAYLGLALNTLELIR